MNRFISAAIASAIVWVATPCSAQTVPQSTTFDVGAAHVVKTGSGTRPIILLPGLACGPYEFADLLPQLAATHPVYALTFAGFDGVAAIRPPYLDAYERSVLELVEREHLVKPIIIGHSLGGHLAVRIAEQYPDLPGAVIAIDALPLFPLPQPGETPQTRHAAAQRFAQMVAAADPMTFARLARMQVASLVTSPQNVNLVVEHELRSDQTTIGGAAAEMMDDDLGPHLGDITAPLLVIAPAPSTAVAQQMKDGYTGLYAGVNDLSVVSIAPAKHFVMLDQPGEFAQTINDFLTKKSPDHG
jgi:pimeloyl-ACP methyl ester carboxylesterase